MEDFARRFRFFGLGILGGTLLVILFFGRRNSCRNYVQDYLPNGRVLSEVRYLPVNYDSVAWETMQKIGIDTAYMNQNVFTKGEIDFERSAPRKKPCGDYILNYQDSLHQLEIRFQKCKEEVRVLQIKE